MVSIVIPNYNHFLFLNERIETILNQTFQDFEIIILDDASTDLSLQTLKKYKYHPKVKHFVVNSINSRTPYLQWLKGIQLASGEYVWIAESDDYSDARFLQKMLAVFDKFPTAGLVFSKSILVDSENRKIEGEQWRYDKFGEVACCFDGNYFATNFLIQNCVILNVSSVVFKRSALENINLNFFSKFKHFGDWILYLQIASQAAVAYMPDGVNYFRRTGKAFSQQETCYTHLIEKVEVQNYCFAQWRDKTLYNQSLDHTYYEAATFFRRNYSNPMTEFPMITQLLRKDIFVRKRIFVFVYYALKRFLSWTGRFR